VDFRARRGRSGKRHKEKFKKTEGVSLNLPSLHRPGRVRRTGASFPAVNCSVDIENQTMTLHHYVKPGYRGRISASRGLVAPGGEER